MKKAFFCLILASFFFLLRPIPSQAADTTSLSQYEFGSGGVATASSSNYSIFAIIGGNATASQSSSNYMNLPGLTYAIMANAPSSPIFTNPSSYYNKLHIIIDTGNNPSTTTYAIAVSTDNFVTDTKYVATDHTLSQNITWQDYTSWGSSSGFDIIGLLPGQTYYAKVTAQRGSFTQSGFGPVASATTVNPTFTFSIQTSTNSVPPFNISIGQINPGSVTTSTDKIIASISTNANGGGSVYINGTNNGLQSPKVSSYKIPTASNDLSVALEGYGARGTSVSQSSGGPMELVSPYNGSGNNVGIVDTSKRPIADSSSKPISNGTLNFEIKAKASNTTPSASDYADTITVVATGSF